MLKKIILLTTFFVFAIFIVDASASVRSSRFSGDASIIDSATLKVGLRTVTIWGIKPIKIENSVIQLQANELLENLTDNGTVSCKIVKDDFPNATARCLSSKDVDLGLELIDKGFAIVDKTQLDNSEFSKIYLEAQQKARSRGDGIWGYLDKEKKKDFINEAISSYVSNSSIWIGLAGVALFIVIAIIVALVWIKKALNRQKEEIEKIYFKEYLLKAKEKGVVISLLRGELEENKSKLKGFVTLYVDMIEDIKSDKREDVLKVTGESIKRAPLLKRKIFDMNANKLSFLDMTVANKLTKLYGSFVKEEEYIEINKSISIDAIKNIIRDSIKDAKTLLLEIDKTINVLDVEYMSILDFIGKHNDATKDAHKKKKTKK